MESVRDRHFVIKVTDKGVSLDRRYTSKFYTSSATHHTNIHTYTCTDIPNIQRNEFTKPQLEQSKI